MFTQLKFRVTFKERRNKIVLSFERSEVKMCFVGSQFLKNLINNLNTT